MAIAVIDAAVQLLDNDAVQIWRQSRLARLASLPAHDVAAREYLWAEIDAADLAIAGNAEARWRVTQLARTGACKPQAN